MSTVELTVAQKNKTYPPRVCYAIDNNSSEMVKFVFDESKSYEVISKWVACK